MIFGEAPLAEAEGAVLAHGIMVGGRRWPKGSLVDKALLAAAAAEGILRLTVARAEAGDVSEGEAATLVAERLAGAHVEMRAPVHGRVNLHAAASGLARLEPQAILAANLACEAVAISTVAPLTPVQAGAMVATVKTIAFAVEGDALARIAPGRLDIVPYRSGLKAVLIQTCLADTSDKMLAKTAEVTKGRLAALGIAMTEAPRVQHRTDAVAEALRTAEADLILVAGAAATSDRRDVVPAALLAAGGRLERVGMPVDPGNLLVLGWLGASPRSGGAMVVGLPGCAKSPKRNGLDLVLERFAAGLPVNGETLAGMGVGGLLDEAGQAVPWGWSG